MLSFARDIAKAITADDTASLRMTRSPMIQFSRTVTFEWAQSLPLLHGGRYKRAGR